MLRMEIALIIILGFIAYMYFSTERKHTKLHRTFSVLLLVVIVHLVFDAVTIYTVNHLEQVPIAVNDAFHRVFVGTMAGVLYLFYRYIAAVVEEETKKKMIFDWLAKIFLIVLEIIALVFPIAYIQTPNGNYSAGAYVIASYGGVAIYLALCAGILIWNWKQIHVKKKFAIGVALWVEFLVCGLQGAYPTWLISGMGITLMTLSFYLTLENPDILRAELTEQKMSMLYLKSQVNPHFLYNTMDMINWMALQGQTEEISHAVQSLSRFYKLTLSRKKGISTIARELEHVTIYVQLQNMRYHDSIELITDIPDELSEYQIPKLTLQPVVENSILHGILEKESKSGTIVITGWMENKDIVLLISDDGVGISPEILSTILSGSGNSQSGGTNIAVYNTHRRLQILYGKDYGLTYSSNPGKGTEVEIRFPAHREE